MQRSEHKQAPARRAQATEPEPEPAVYGEPEPPTPGARAPAPIPLPLPHFYAKLASLLSLRDGAEREGEAMQDVVRVAWFGDSHTAADFLTGALRERLQSVFGDAGPGFVPIGTSLGRHEQVAVQVKGRWVREPPSPASHVRVSDGILGLSGLGAKAEPYSGSLRLHMRRGQVPPAETMTWRIVLRSPDGPFSWHARAGEQVAKLRFDGARWSATASDVAVRGSQLMAWTLDVPTGEALELLPPSSEVEVFGAFGETAGPGVVLDTLGINGARIRTTRAWHEGTFVGELAERGPALVVLAYGTNELGDRARPEHYAPYYEAMLELVRTASPDADCLLVGPTDRRDADGHSLARVAQLDDFQRQFASEAGCAYFSLAQAMGGAGGYQRWARSEPPLAGGDGVHLTALGYVKLAEALVDSLRESFELSTGLSWQRPSH